MSWTWPIRLLCPPYMSGRGTIRTDSLENRREYKKAFDYGYSYVDKMNAGRGGRSLGVGIDLDLLFNGKKNRQMLALQKRLEWEETDKYIDYRWNRAMLTRVTGLEPPALDSFMRQYRPSKEFIQSCATDYEFYHYIREWNKYFSDDWTKSACASPGPAAPPQTVKDSPWGARMMGLTLMCPTLIVPARPVCAYRRLVSLFHG